MAGNTGRNEMRLPQNWRRPTKPAFLINALILMALMVDFNVVAIRAPHNIAQVAGRSVRDNTKEENYQSNYEDDAATVSGGLSTGYTLAHNYYQSAASHGVADNTPTYGDTAGSTARYENLQRFGAVPTDVAFLPSTMTAAGQHFVAAQRNVASEHASNNAATSPQIGGLHATGPYITPGGKIDYEINAANYDVTSETANGGMKADEQSTGVIETNDAYNIAMLQDMVHVHQQQQQQQHHQQQQLHLQQQQQKIQRQQQQHHQLTYTGEGTPTEQDNIDEIISFKNYDTPPATTLAYTPETKHQYQHQHPNANAHVHTHTHTHTHANANANEQYLHNLEMLQYANYDRKPTESEDIFNQNTLVKGGQRHNHPYSFTSLVQPTGSDVFRVNHHAKDHQLYHHNHQEYQHPQQHHRQLHQSHQIHQDTIQRDNTFNDDSLKPQSQYYYTHAPRARASHERSLNLHDIQQDVNSIQPPLPSVTQSVVHTPASSAAVAGIPLSRHVEVVKHVHVPHYKREHIPYNHSVPIEIPHPVITTVPKPTPIQVPVSQTVAIPQLQVVRIPIEQVKPMPVERAVPFIVEKHVPYKVEKQVAKPVYYPYPIKVPVVTTVFHRAPHNDYHHHHQNSGYRHYSHPRQLLYTKVITKKLH